MRRLSLCSAALVLVLFACSPGAHDYFLDAAGPDNQEVQELYAALVGNPNGNEPAAGSNRVVASERLAGYMVRSGHAERMVVLLTTLVAEQPDDPYGAYYLYLVARHYQETGALPIARHYYERVVGDYDDLTIHGTSLHLSSLRALIDLTRDPFKRASYYQRLIDDHRNAVDEGRVYYYLANTLEDLGEWERSYAAYREFVRRPETEIPGLPRAHEGVAAKLAFYDSDKSWVVDRLDDLRQRIGWAIATKNAGELLRYRAKVNFFTRSWEQENTDPNATPDWDIGSLLQRSRYVVVAPEIDISSNADEAYLYTHGWGLRIPTWYLYFRRVDFPADPEVHNSWEWAGVFLGERL